jgi:hypothetical protein
VASGSLGTAANLDDTQVMHTADLQRAAAEIAVPAWLTNNVPPLPEEPVRDPRDLPVREPVQPRAGMRARGQAKPASSRGGVSVSRRTSALAGAAAGAALVLLAGAALLGNLGSVAPKPAAGQGPFADSSLAPITTPTPEPTKEGKGCHGNGKGNDCKGGGD